MNEPEEMASEFGTVASWSVDAARELGPRFHVPAGCRGSGGPPAMDWLLDRLPDVPAELLLDVGAGVGGPAAYARERRGARVVPAEPEEQACEAAGQLFGLEAVCASATGLPFGTGEFASAWCIGVLCTIPDHGAALREIARVIRPGGRVGMLVYARTGPLDEQPEGNNFPALDRLEQLYRSAGLEPVDQALLADLPAPPQDWKDAEQAVADRIERQHGDDPRWQQAREQEAVIGRLIGSGDVVGHLAVLVRHADAGSAHPSGA